MWRSSLISNIAFHNGKLLIKIALFHGSISRMSRIQAALREHSKSMFAQNSLFLIPPPTPYSTLLVLEIPPHPMYNCFLLGNSHPL